MEPGDPYLQLSPEAVRIVDQLVDISHDIARDEGSPEVAGIEWYLLDEEPPMNALEELERAGICRHHRKNQSIIVNFTLDGEKRHT